LPRTSGKTSALVLGLCFALAAVLFLPLARWWPMWVRFEVVLAVWWALWAAALAHLLYHGTRVTDDHAMSAPRNWLGNAGGPDPGWFLWPELGCGEGCATGLAVIAAGVLLFIGLWFLIEVAVPGLAFLSYFLIRGSLAHVVNDRHHCQGRLIDSVLWGAFWATLYVLPLTLVTWAAHLMWLQHHG
jgi:hypothetical protein